MMTFEVSLFPPVVEVLNIAAHNIYKTRKWLILEAADGVERQGKI